MARAPRDPQPGIYHLTARSVSLMPLFQDDVDRMDFNRQLGNLAKRPKWACLAACLMTTHYHLLVEVQDESLPIGVQQLNSRYAQRFNARHALRGHVFASRYWSRLIESEEHLLTAFRYLARNPVAAGLCDGPADWPWSSYASAVGLRNDYPWCRPHIILAYFGRPAAAAIRRLQTFVEAP